MVNKHTKHAECKPEFEITGFAIFLVFTEIQLRRHRHAVLRPAGCQTAPHRAAPARTAGGQTKGGASGGGLGQVARLRACSVYSVYSMHSMCSMYSMYSMCNLYSMYRMYRMCNLYSMYSFSACAYVHYIYILVRSAGCRPPRAREHFMFGATSARPSPLPFIWHLTSRRLVARLAPASGKEATWTAVALKPCMSQ